jgi:MGT family glycosyltransferase
MDNNWKPTQKPMASILFYTSPAKGHLFPILGAALELHGRGHRVHIRTLASEMDLVRRLGLQSEPISPEIEARELDDWKARGPIGAVGLAMKTFGDRAVQEVPDLQTAIQQTGAEVLVVDTNTWGAQAAAEASGLPWAVFQPYFTFLPAPEVPPFGPGFPNTNGVIGRLRNVLAGKMIFSKMNGLALPSINAIRTSLQLDPLNSLVDMVARPHRFLYYTVKELDYPRKSWPAHFRFVGPGLWAPQAQTPGWLHETDRPVALVTCSTERQSDRPIVEAALQSLPDEGFYVVATSAAYDPGELTTLAGSYTRLEQFLPHDPVVKRASVVICHGGMGITQRALSHGVPVVVIPFGRDQLEVARRVEYAGVGVRLLPKQLNRETLSAAVRRATAMQKAAGKLALSMAAAGGSSRAAGNIEELLS